MKPFKDLTQAGLVARAFMVFPLAAVGIGLLGYGDTHGIVWMLPVGGVLFAIAFVVIGLCAFHGFNGPLSFGRPMPPRRDGTRGTPEEDDAEREEIRERLRQTQRRGLTVFPLALAGVVLGSSARSCRTRRCPRSPPTCSAPGSCCSLRRPSRG